MRATGQQRRDGPGRPPEGNRPVVEITTAPAAQPVTYTPKVAHHADAADELDGWALAVLHLHAAGLPAAVPEFAARHLARHGVTADWMVAA